MFHHRLAIADTGEPEPFVKPKLPPPPAARDIFTPWGAYGAGGKRKKGPLPKAPSSAAAAAAAAAAQQQQLPKALLQKHCQQKGWAAPRFERVIVVGVVGTGDEAGKEHRYSVTVDPGVTWVFVACAIRSMPYQPLHSTAAAYGPGST